MKPIALVALLLVACGATPSATAPMTAGAPQKERRYAVPSEVGILVVDKGEFAKLAVSLRTDAELDLRGQLDKDARKDRYFLLALLDAIDDRWPAAKANIDRIVAIEERPQLRIMTGLTIRVWSDAKARGESFRTALERSVAAMPIDDVRSGLSMLRSMGQVFTPDTCRKLVNESIGADVKDGTVSFEDAQAIAFQRYAVVWLVQVGKDIDEVLGSHGIDPQPESSGD